MTARVTCVTCGRFDLRAAGDMARQGFGRCERLQPWLLVSATYDRLCAAHHPAAEGLPESRVRWLDKQQAAQRHAAQRHATPDLFSSSMRTHP
jgi:hypothetical protein